MRFEERVPTGLVVWMTFLIIFGLATALFSGGLTILLSIGIAWAWYRSWKSGGAKYLHVTPDAVFIRDKRGSIHGVFYRALTSVKVDGMNLRFSSPGKREAVFRPPSVREPATYLARLGWNVDPGWLASR